MIFIALGTQKFQLNRLLIEVDNLVENGKIKEPVFAQSGHSDYHPKHYDYIDHLNRQQFEEKVENCSLVITHSGVGTIVTGLKYKKPIIVYPRLAKYKEHVDDHQLQIANSFERLNYVVLCGEEDDLFESIKEAENHKFDVYVSQRDKLLEKVSDYLENI